MLFLFRGRNGPLVRVVLGAVLIVLGLVVHGGAILAGIGVVLLVWGGMGALSALRARRRVSESGRML
jgi:membrane-bound ClpP family serine protease